MNRLLITLLAFLILQSPAVSQSFFRNKIADTNFGEINPLRAVLAIQRKAQNLEKSKQGFNFVFTVKAQHALQKKINLSLGSLSIAENLNYVALLADIQVKYEGRTAIFLGKGEKFKNPVIKENFVKRDLKFMASLRLSCPPMSFEGETFKEGVKKIKDKIDEKHRQKVNIIQSSSSNAKLIMDLRGLNAYSALRYLCLASGVTMKIDRAALVLK